MKKVKPIYFVTVFYVDWDKPVGQTLYKRIRCWGWFANEKDAVKCIKENWTDIYEIGYYNLAMIEPMGQGPCAFAPTKSNRWFNVEYVDQNTYNVAEIGVPDRFKRHCGFSYA